MVESNSVVVSSVVDRMKDRVTGGELAEAAPERTAGRAMLPAKPTRDCYNDHKKARPEPG